ncbi:molybdate ABC transporter permease subunit [Clostridium nigeriense]|uniref:molybdate ABC transporter permease subunit n=1 Tax=Clostridium nigeriense TaxID=1805470 RepID=UPI003D3316D9
MDISPIIISLKTATISMIFTFLLGVFIAKFIVNIRYEKVKMILDGILTLPLVLPPTVMGFFLLIVFGVNRPIGKMLLDFLGVKIVFSWSATVIASIVISFPLMYRSARGAFEQVDKNLIMAARTLGMSERKIFWSIIMPMALPGVAAGGILAFARGLGEFGATAMIAGNIANKTRTLPLAIYSEVSAGNMDIALNYVLIVTLISFVVVVLTNYFTIKERKYLK